MHASITSPSSRMRSRRAAPVVCLIAFTTTSLWSSPATGSGVNQTEAAVMKWLDDTDPAIYIDGTPTCDGTVPDLVPYRNDRIVLRAPAAFNDVMVKNTVNARLNLMYAGPWRNYVKSVERITFTIAPPIHDVVSVTLWPRPGGVAHEIVSASRHLRGDTGHDVAPDYGLTTSSHYSYYEPHGNPRPVTALTPPRSILTPAGNPIGHGVKIEVFDTGLSSGQGLPTTTKFESIDNELANRDTSGDPLLVDYKHAGHGRAIAGVITTIAPGATIEVARVNERSGVLTDVSAARRIAAVMNALSATPNEYPEIIVMSFATAPCVIDPVTGAGHMTPVGTGAVVELVERLNATKPGGMVIVASAGNMDSRTPHYPAAFDSVVSVGALDGRVGSDGSPWSDLASTAPIADFSNRGDWVDAYAVGVALPTTHLNGVRFESTEPILNGLAEVDGTSFSAPLVAGHIAELMSLEGQRADLAAETLLASAEQPLPECGTTMTESGAAIVLADLTLTIVDTTTAVPTTC